MRMTLVFIIVVNFLNKHYYKLIDSRWFHIGHDLYLEPKIWFIKLLWTKTCPESLLKRWSQAQFLCAQTRVSWKMSKQWWSREQNGLMINTWLTTWLAWNINKDDIRGFFFSLFLVDCKQCVFLLICCCELVFKFRTLILVWKQTCWRRLRGGSTFGFEMEQLCDKAQISRPSLTLSPRSKEQYTIFGC